MSRKPWVVVLALLVTTPLALLLSVMSGPVDIDFLPLLRSLFWSADDPRRELISGAWAIVEAIRLPRTALAWLVGAALAMGGACMQGLFRNPLADPSIIGVTSGASLGAGIAIVFGGAIGVGSTHAALGGLSLLVAGAFVGGVLATALVYSLATTTNRRGKLVAGMATSGTSVATMLLVGIAITALAGAMNSLLAYVGDNEALRRISLWNMGGLDMASKQRVWLGVVIIAPVCLVLARFAARLDALLLGESEARFLGIDVERMKRQLIALVALIVATSVALAGVIAFVGLVVPHMLRITIGPGHRLLLPCSALGGGLLLVLADTVARVALAPAEIPVGVLTALLGAPLFVSLLRRKNDYAMV